MAAAAMRWIMKRFLLMCMFWSVLGWWGQPAQAMNLQVHGADVAPLLQSVARLAQLNLVVDESVKGKISLQLADVEPAQAIEYIVEARGLSLTRDGEVWLVASKENLQQGCGRIHVIPVQYALLEDLKAAVELNYKTMTDISSGSLLVYGTAEEAAQVRQLVQQLDVPASQVAIEAKVMSLDEESAKRLGVQWEWSAVPVSHNLSMDAAATLEAMLTEGKVDILSRPNITTLQGQEAVINIGGEVPVPSVSVTNSTTTTSIEYRPVGIILKCQPMVNEDGYITSRIHTEVSSPKYVEDLKAYSFQKRSADTMVRLKDGETMVIGGLISSEDSKTIGKIPFLSEIPILGNFFKYSQQKHTKSEICITLKAKIVSKNNIM